MPDQLFLTGVYLVVIELIDSLQGSIGHALIDARYLDLLFVLMYFLQIITMHGKLVELAMQFLLHGNRYLVSTAGNDAD